MNYNNYCIKFSSQVNFTTKIEPFAWTNGSISLGTYFTDPFFLGICEYVNKLFINNTWKLSICVTLNKLFLYIDFDFLVLTEQEPVVTILYPAGTGTSLALIDVAFLSTTISPVATILFVFANL